jgi:hypothetical protein
MIKNSRNETLIENIRNEQERLIMALMYDRQKRRDYYKRMEIEKLAEAKRGGS